MPTKRLTSQMDALDIRTVKRRGRLSPGESCIWTWTRSSGVQSRISMYAHDDAVTLSYRTKSHDEDEWKDISYRVKVARTPCNYGGSRDWWICPGCGKRVAILFGGGRYLCRHCHGLTYRSTRIQPGSAHYARANKVRERLGWGGGVASPMGEKPKGMHWATYLHHLTMLNKHGMAAMETTDNLVDRVTASLSKYGLT